MFNVVLAFLNATSAFCTAAGSPRGLKLRLQHLLQVQVRVRRVNTLQFVRNCRAQAEVNGLFNPAFADALKSALERNGTDALYSASVPAEP